jgi:hypothetical protein
LKKGILDFLGTKRFIITLELHQTMKETIHIYRTRETNEPVGHPGMKIYCMIPHSLQAKRGVTGRGVDVEGEVRRADPLFWDELNPETVISGVSEEVSQFIKKHGVSVNSPLRFDVHPDLPHYESFLPDRSSNPMYVIREDLNPEEIRQVLKSLRGERVY